MSQISHAKLLKLTKELIEFKSISPYDDGAIDYLSKYLSQLGAQVTRCDRGKTKNLIARFGTKTPIFAFAGHVDVVPPGDVKNWHASPFTLHEDDECYYGRGIADMKGAVTAFIAALEAYLTEQPPTVDGSIMLLLTADEEGLATDGTTAIVDYLTQENVTIDYCILGEPTSVNILGDVIKIGRRGSLTGHIEVIGKQGHIAYPKLCQNPIHDFAPALTQLSTHEFDQGTEFFPPTSLQFANLNAGLGVTNVVPGSLFTNFNIRYNDSHTTDSLIKSVTQILDQHKLNYKINWKHSANPFFTTPGKLLEVVNSSITKQLNITPQAKTDGGTSDGRFLVKICKELLEFGLQNKYIHQVNERILKNDLFALASTYHLILSKIFNNENT